MTLKKYKDMSEGYIPTPDPNMYKKRESVRMRDICERGNLDWLNDGWGLSDEKQIRFDGEKGFVDMEAIIWRTRDDKFFRVRYTKFGQGRTNLLDQTADEVYRRAVTTYEYY